MRERKMTFQMAKSQKINGLFRTVRLACAIAVMSAASIELMTQLQEPATFGISGLIGIVSALVLQKAAIIA